MPSTTIVKEDIFTPPRFVGNNNKAFATALKTAVNNYFVNQHIKKSGGTKFLLKIPVVFGLYLTPYFFILLSNPTTLVAWILCILMGLGMASIGLVVMHDANHHNATNNPKLNKLLTYSMTILGGSPVLWRIQHNVLHHTYTNIEHYDEDLDAIGLLRFSPNSKYKPVHRFQHIYAWFFYSLLTINWAGHDDYIQLKRYAKMDLLKGQKTNYWKEVGGITLTKLLYFSYLIGLPLLFTEFTWWQVLLGFLSMHMVAGLILSLIFQAAHVTDTSEFLPKTNLEIEENWLVHQLKTSKNFGVKSKWFTWIIGGLNHQIEHHLFPNISHVHYSAIAGIVKEVAAEHKVSYFETKTFFGAVKEHFTFLRSLGKG